MPKILDPKDLLIEDYLMTKGTSIAPSPVVRITHKPTGIVVMSAGDRSQHLNKRDALAKLSELLDALGTT